MVDRIETDVAVIGVGAMGSATLWRLAERGVPVIGFEQFDPGHDHGSSHGQSRIFRTAYLEGPSYVPLAQRAIELWRELQQVGGVPLVVQNGALTVGPRESSIVRDTEESIRVHDLPHRLLTTEEVRTRYPCQRVDDDEVAIYEHQAGLVRPERAIVASVRRAEQLGARVVRGKRVNQVELRPDSVRVVAEDLVCDARHAVVSVGAWLGHLLPGLRLPLRVTRQIIAWFPVEREEQFLPERFPVFLRDLGPYSAGGRQFDSTFYGFPTLDGQTIKVGIHREGEAADPDTLDRTVTPGDLAPIQDCVLRFLHGVRTDPVHAQVCMYTNTPDHDFLIGSPPEMPQATILGGFSGHGFKFAPVVGEVGADLSTKGATKYPVAWLSLDRFLPRRELPLKS